MLEQLEPIEAFIVNLFLDIDIFEWILTEEHVVKYDPC